MVACFGGEVESQVKVKVKVERQGYESLEWEGREKDGAALFFCPFNFGQKTGEEQDPFRQQHIT